MWYNVEMELLIILGGVLVIIVALWFILLRLDEIPRRVYAAKYRYNDEPIIWAEQDVPINIQALRDGLTDAFTRASLQGYQEKLELKDYTIAVLRGEKYKDFWCLKIPAGKYKDTVYDNNGFVYATDYVVDPQGIIAVAWHPFGEYDKLKQAVAAGAEHCILYHNDYDKYKATKLHLDSGHPLF